MSSRSYQYEVKSSYRESNNETAPPDVMYWREGIDGTSDEWTEWVEGQPGFEPICTFRKMPRAKQQREDGRSNSDDDWADRIPSESEDAEGEAADAPGNSTSPPARTAPINDLFSVCSDAPQGYSFGNGMMK